MITKKSSQLLDRLYGREGTLWGSSTLRAPASEKRNPRALAELPVSTLYAPDWSTQRATTITVTYDYDISFVGRSTHIHTNRETTAKGGIPLALEERHQIH